MKKSQKGESFAGIVVWVFILSFVILGIVNILIFSTNITEKYDEANRVELLKTNLTKIIQNTDTSNLKENEIFYVHKNRATGEYELYTGSTYENYKYIDENGESISNILAYSGDIYSQILWVSKEDTSFWDQNQVIKVSIKKLVKK